MYLETTIVAETNTEASLTALPGVYIRVIQFRVTKKIESLYHGSSQLPLYSRELAKSYPKTILVIHFLNLVIFVMLKFVLNIQKILSITWNTHCHIIITVIKLITGI